MDNLNKIFNIKFNNKSLSDDCFKQEITPGAKYQVSINYSLGQFYMYNIVPGKFFHKLLLNQQDVAYKIKDRDYYDFFNLTFKFLHPQDERTICEMRGKIKSFCPNYTSCYIDGEFKIVQYRMDNFLLGVQGFFKMIKNIICGF